MKSSDSATSLSQLNVCDTGCHFCSEGADAENAAPLVDSKTFLTCGCRFATHADCWATYMEATTEDGARPPCPLCQKPVRPAVLTVAPDAQKEFRKHRNAMACLAFSVVAGLTLIIFVIVYSVHSRT